MFAQCTAVRAVDSERDVGTEAGPVTNVALMHRRPVERGVRALQKDSHEA